MSFWKGVLRDYLLRRRWVPKFPGNKRKRQLLRSLFSDPLPEGHPVDRDSFLCLTISVRFRRFRAMLNNLMGFWSNLRRFGRFLGDTSTNGRVIGGAPTTPDPNTSAKVWRYKWELHRDTNRWCIYYFLPRGGHTFAKASRWKWVVYGDAFQSIGVGGRFDSPEVWAFRWDLSQFKAIWSILGDLGDF